MSDNFSIEKIILYPYWKQESSTDDEKFESSAILEKVSIGNYVEALKDEEALKALTFNVSDSISNRTSIHEFYKQNFTSYLEGGGRKAEEVLFSIGVSCLQLFVQNNFCGPLVGPPAHTLIPFLIPSDSNETETRDCALKELFIDTDGIYTMIALPELLIIARIVFFDLQENLSSFLTVDWWCFRYCIIHQKIADESSESLHDIMMKSIGRIEASKIISEEDRDICALFHLETVNGFLFYYDVKNAKEHVNKALNVLGMEIDLTGALGVRTKWQERKIAQLVAKVSYTNKHLTSEEQKGPFLLPTDLPKDVVLNDETRLNKIKFIEEDEDVIPNLRPVEQMALFGQFLLLRKSQAQDDQLTEQSKAYLVSILQYPKNWALQLSALLMRSKIESNETRAMERSLIQLEELVKAIQVEEPSRFERLKLIYSSSLLTHWNVQKELASMLIRLGLCEDRFRNF
ncbi:Tetratricopeptide repeat protein 27 [Armadillidium nasatum]|uniref:Tetratricopeptide repeat protein 27 n=1 Tax=Armadillidium nasatum TaxID=96803 RepID=A0A5N5TLM2_9CRUS|nr:Tetratricopeptide repeat protein 27 [Armadillidium nasatum]